MKKLRGLLSLVTVVVLLACSSINVYAYANYAYSMGGEFFSGADVIQACDYWALCGYTSYYTINPTYSYVSSANRLNSDILYFSAHGNQHLIELKNDIYITDGYNNSSANEVGIKSYNLSNTKLVVYDACETAVGSSNLCTATINSGADAVIGWRVSIGVADALKWQERFQNYCAAGYKVHLAMDYADSFSDYDENSLIKNHLIYGNWTQVIKKTSASSANRLSEDTVLLQYEGKDRIIDISEIHCSYDSINYDAIEAAISKEFPGFVASDYEITITSTSLDNKNFVVDYNLKNGQFVTNSGYTLLFRDNKTTAIYDNTISFVTRQTNNANGKVPNYSDYVEQALSYAAMTVIEMNDGSSVIEQTWAPYYDVENNTYYIKVFTAYDYRNNGCYGAYSTLYPLKADLN